MTSSGSDKDERPAKRRVVQRALPGLFALAVLATALLAIRSRQSLSAWEQCRKELEAKGEKLDWQAFIPSAVPDERNLFKAPGMTAWFSRQSWQTNRVKVFSLPSWVTAPPLLLDDLRALPEESNTGDAPHAQSRAGLREWSAQVEPEYRLLVEACARPEARFDTDFSNPFAMDVPNFVNLRGVAQALATHASLSLLEGRPDLVVQDLFMMRRLADLSGSSLPLVSAMIRVGIMGLYTQTAREALESGTLSDTQLKAIHDQIRDIDLLSNLTQSLRAERAIHVSLLTMTPKELTRLLRPITAKSKAAPSWALWTVDWGAWLSDLRFRLRLRSARWLSRNMIFICQFHQEALDDLDVSQRVHAAEVDRVLAGLQRIPSHLELAAVVIPNYARAAETTARNQTLLDQLRVACALERYRLALGGYPENLEALVPAYLDVIPNDLLADQPLQYHRDEAGGYMIWSVGWNETDEAGTAGTDKNGKPAYDSKTGDWVWSRTTPLRPPSSLPSSEIHVRPSP